MDTLQNDQESKIDELMNDCDMELITLEEMELTDNQDKGSYLIPETNVYLIDEGTTHIIEEEKLNESIAQLTTNCKGQTRH